MIVSILNRYAVEKQRWSLIADDHVEMFKKNSVDLMRPSMENCMFPHLF